MKTNHVIFIISDRGMDDWLTLSRLLDKLGWAHYPEYVTGEEIDEGDDSEDARTEGVDVPTEDTDLFDMLESRGVFDV